MTARNRTANSVSPAPFKRYADPDGTRMIRFAAPPAGLQVHFEDPAGSADDHDLFQLGGPASPLFCWVTRNTQYDYCGALLLNAASGDTSSLFGQSDEQTAEMFGARWADVMLRTIARRAGALWDELCDDAMAPAEPCGAWRWTEGAHCSNPQAFLAACLAVWPSARVRLARNPVTGERDRTGLWAFLPPHCATPAPGAHTSRRCGERYNATKPPEGVEVAP